MRLEYKLALSTLLVGSAIIGGMYYKKISVYIATYNNSTWQIKEQK